MTKAGSPRVQVAMKKLKILEANAHNSFEDVHPTTKKAAQKLTNFRAYLHKSSVAGCFAGLLDMTSEGVMTEAGLYPSSRMKKSRNLRQAGLGNKSRSRTTAGSSVLMHSHNKQALRGSSTDRQEALDVQQQQQQQSQTHSTREDGGGGGGGDPVRGGRDHTRDIFDGAQSSRPAGVRGALQQRGQRRQRPSTALETPSPPLLAQAPDAPLTSRAGAAAGRFAGAGARILTSPSCRNDNNSGMMRSGAGTSDGGRLSSSTAAAAAVERGSGEVSTIDIRRTQWVDGDIKVGGKEGGWVLEASVIGQQQQQERVGGTAADMAGPETNDGEEVEPRAEEEGRRGGGGRGGGGCRRRSSTSSSGSARPSAPRLAWGHAMREVTTTVSKVTQMKTAATRVMANDIDERRRRAVIVRAELIEGEKLRAQELLSKNDNRKQQALEASALLASQRGLLGAITLVLATKRLWVEGMKLARRREQEFELGKAAKIVQRAFKAHTNRRMFKVLLSIRRMHLQLHIGINIRRKKLAVNKIVWFLTTGNGGAKARPRKVIRAFMYQVRRCQRAAKEWLACRAASIEAVCRLWDRIESEIRRGLGDELDRAKRVWMKNALRTGEDSHMHGQWRELKAKTRGLMARINRLEAQIERQQKRDKAARLLAARSMLKRRAPLGSDGMTRGNYRVSQMDSAEDLRTSTVTSGKRLAIIRSSLNNKFSLHQQGGSRRMERPGNRVIGEMDARMVIRGEFPDAPPDPRNEGASNKVGSAPTVVRSTKRPRALIYTGDLGRSWQQIVEDIVMQDFRRNAFARKDSMPYLKYSVVLSLDLLDATGSVEGPSAAFAAAAAAAGGNSGVATSLVDGQGRSANAPNSGRGASSSAIDSRQRATQESLGAGGGGAARLMLEPIL